MSIGPEESAAPRSAHATAIWPLGPRAAHGRPSGNEATLPVRSFIRMADANVTPLSCEMDSQRSFEVPEPVT